MSLNYRSFNQLTLVGRLGADVQLKQTQQGTAYCNLSVATQTLTKSQDGQWEHPTVWHNVTLWGNRAEKMAQFLKKGTTVLVVGSITYREKETNGVKSKFVDINVDDIQLLSSNSSAPSTGGASGAVKAQPQRRPASAKTTKTTNESTDLEDGDYEF